MNSWVYWVDTWQYQTILLYLKIVILNKYRISEVYHGQTILFYQSFLCLYLLTILKKKNYCANSSIYPK